MHQNEIRYRNLLNSLPGVAYQFHITEGGKPRFDYVSGNCIDLFGLSEQSIMADADRLAALIPESDMRHLDQVVKTSADSNTPYVAEHRIQLPDGSVRHVQELAEIVRDDRGRVVWMSGTVQDITARKAVEIKLKESEERYRMLFQNAQDAIFVVDPETGTLLDVNKYAQTLTGYSREELIGKHQTFVHPPEDSAFYRDEFRRATRQEGIQFYEMLVRNKDGRHIPVEISSGGTINVGKDKLHIGIFRDISKRKKAETAIKASEKKFKELAELLPEGVFETDADMCLSFTNQRALSMFGYSADEIKARLSSFHMLAPEDRDRAKKNIAKRMEGRRLPAIEYRAKKKTVRYFRSCCMRSRL